MSPADAFDGMGSFFDRHGIKILLALVAYMLVTREITQHNNTDIAVMGTRLELELRPIKEDIAAIKAKLERVENDPFTGADAERLESRIDRIERIVLPSPVRVE